MINKKWDWAGKILEQLPTRLVKVERQLKKKSVFVDRGGQK